MIEHDMSILENHFEHATINVFVNNTTTIKRDEALVQWFIKNYAYLNQDPRFEILYNNTDFGVGD